MTGRRSARAAAKAPVKYRSDSENSDFGDKKRKRSTKKTAATPRQGARRSQSPDDEAEKTPKRRKKSPETLAAEHKEKSRIQEQKAAKQQAKQQWEEWLSKNDVSGKLLDTEPERDEAVTQTDAHKQYDLKANELVTLERFEKPNQYGGQTKLFLAAEAKKVAIRKYGLLAGFTEEAEILKKGEELLEEWKERHSKDAQATPTKPKKEIAVGDTPKKAKTHKQKWAAYVEEHNVGDKKLSEEPEESINQTDSKTQFQLLPGDLVCLPYFPKPNPKYGNTTKFFNRADIKELSYRKQATIGGVEEIEDPEEFLSKGKELLLAAVAAAAKSKAPAEA
ncbi:hypothetical protein E8E12_006161 [Didymella heteroderae]|uniref:Uncharacterized protein n=1 Tax=Didymella heteroderae TaxID=1769908 RepID=A0A9P5BY32_9PLEO|nr:hypothetical protein E8E12_006161 [Didymella heteroderae]